MHYILPSSTKSLLDLLHRNKIELLGMKTTDKRDEYELVIRVKY